MVGPSPSQPFAGRQGVTKKCGSCLRIYNTHVQEPTCPHKQKVSSVEARQIRQDQASGIKFEKNIPIPTKGGGKETPYTRAVRLLANDDTEIGVSFFIEGKANASTPQKYGIGWFVIRSVEEDGRKGQRVWKTHQAPGEGKTVPGYQRPARITKMLDAKAKKADES